MHNTVFSVCVCVFMHKSDGKTYTVCTNVYIKNICIGKYIDESEFLSRCSLMRRLIPLLDPFISRL